MQGVFYRVIPLDIKVGNQEIGLEITNDKFRIRIYATQQNGLPVYCGNVVSIYAKSLYAKSPRGFYVLDRHHGVSETLCKALKLVEDSSPIIL